MISAPDMHIVTVLLLLCAFAAGGAVLAILTRWHLWGF